MENTFTLSVVVIGVLLPLASIGAAQLYLHAPQRRSAVIRERTRREATEIALERAARLDRERQALLAFAAHDRETAAAQTRPAVSASGAQVVDIGVELRRNYAALRGAA